MDAESKRYVDQQNAQLKKELLSKISGNTKNVNKADNTSIVCEWGKISGDIAAQIDLLNILSSKVSASSLATVATSGNYNDLSNKPTIPVLPSLSTVATSGNYTDLSGRPTLGTAAALDVGTTANKVVQLDTGGKLPPVDGSQLLNLPSSSGVPTGSVFPFAGSSAPSGFLFCNGAIVNRTTYATLFASIGTTYGGGDGSTTFALPDLRGRTVIGSGTGSGLTSRTHGATGGAETHTLSIGEIPSHNHGLPTRYPFTAGGSSPMYPYADSYARYTTAYTDTTGSGLSHNNMQPWISLNYIIKI